MKRKAAPLDRRQARGLLAGPTLAAVLLLSCTRPNPQYEQPSDAGVDFPDTALPLPDLQVQPDPPARFGVVADQQGEILEGVPFRLAVIPLDEDGQVVRSYKGVLRLKATRGDIEPRVVEVDSTPAAGLRFPVQLNREGPVVIRVQDGDTLGETVALQVRHGHWQPLSDPLFPRDGEESWDARDAWTAEVRAVGEGLVMYYRGKPLSGTAWVGGIGRADSPDHGLNWNRLASAVLPDVPGNEFHNYTSPSFLPQEGGWLLWMTDEHAGRLTIGQASSADGLVWSVWPGGAALTPVADQQGVRDPCVLASATGGYDMWYTLNHSDRQAIGWAHSPDGSSWTARETPVLQGDEGAWDSTTVAAPSVLLDGSVYRMWYTGGDGITARIGYATSSDGIRWEKSPDNPVLSPSADAPFAERKVEHPAAVRLEGETLLFFSGFDGSRWRLGKAVRSGE